jgi:O-acetyl-ADP-ribose deacetylase (regulator of RNase III)
MAITFVQGDIFKTKMKTIVVPVNIMAVAGCGVALQWKRRYPEAFRYYVRDCKHGLLLPGKPTYYLSPATQYPHFFIFFATKDDWRKPSQLGWIDEGLRALTEIQKDTDFQSLATVKLGCGAGGLDWEDVKPVMVGHFEKWDISIEVYGEDR